MRIKNGKNVQENSKSQKSLNYKLHVQEIAKENKLKVNANPVYTLL